MKVLLVEDRPADIRLTIRALQKAGYSPDGEGGVGVAVTIDVALNGRKALDYLKTNRPDIILLDWVMPLLNGEEVLQAIKSDPDLSSIPVVVLTTSSAEKDYLSAYRIGCNAYLCKPVQTEEFQEVIQTFGDFWLSKAVLPRPSTINTTNAPH